MPRGTKGTQQGKGPTRDRPTGDRPPHRGDFHKTREQPTQGGDPHRRHTDTYHTYCLDPVLKEVPEGDWRCQKCVRWGLLCVVINSHIYPRTLSQNSGLTLTSLPHPVPRPRAQIVPESDWRCPKCVRCGFLYLCCTSWKLTKNYIPNPSTNFEVLCGLPHLLPGPKK